MAREKVLREPGNRGGSTSGKGGMAVMRIRAVFGFVILLAFSQATFAGSPLKGADVKLGKSPGGGCSARMRDGNGNADFGIWPKGNYYIIVSSSPGQSRTHLVIRGTTAGLLERDIDAGKAARATPVTFSLNGNTALEVTLSSEVIGLNPKPLDAAKVRSHSNQTNN